MKFMKRILSAALLGLMASALVAAPVAAQSFGPTYDVPAQLQTYQASFTALTPAASATDFFQITGSTGHQIQIWRIHCDGTSTAAATALITVIKRSTADTSGTSTSPTAVPLNGNNSAANATLKAYTANPTLGTAIGTIAEGYLTTGTTASSAFNNGGINFDFTNQHVILNTTAGTLTLSAGGVSFSSGASLNCWVQWSEA